MKEVFVVEYGSFYDNDPWEIRGIFSSNELAEKYVLSKDKFSLPATNCSLYHITPYILDGQINN